MNIDWDAIELEAKNRSHKLQRAEARAIRHGNSVAELTAQIDRIEHVRNYICDRIWRSEQTTK